ncbi:MAG: hypothetical protein M1823_001376 [Watsoniomyces obsoletus]|nr:MAG: hypothetical protein M1823_001376 [Watsoniomyces obsoletus]
MSSKKLVPIPRNGVDYRQKVVLAPMVRTGELPTRLLALKYGADLVWGPETIDRAMIGTTRRLNPHTSTVDFTRFPSQGAPQRESVIFRTHPVLEHGKLIFQLGTASPERAVEAAKLVAGDVAGIDVNAGCPKPFSVVGGMGAALLRTPDTLCAILEALVREVGSHFEIGISVKIRLLETPEMTADLVRKLCGTGITGLTVHCRTTPMRPREKAIRDQLRMIAGICLERGVACLMNGDVENRDHAMELMKEYEVDGAMIATCAEANPSCFRSKADGGLVPGHIIVKEYLQTAIEVNNRWGNTKYLLGHLVPGKDPRHQQVMQSHTYTQLCDIFQLGEDLKIAAQELDARIGIAKDEKESKQGKKAKKRQNEAAVIERGPNMKRLKSPAVEQRPRQPLLSPS